MELKWDTREAHVSMELGYLKELMVNKSLVDGTYYSWIALP
jgi:hypothetical protein